MSVVSFTVQGITDSPSALASATIRASRSRKKGDQIRPARLLREGKRCPALGIPHQGIRPRFDQFHGHKGRMKRGDGVMERSPPLGILRLGIHSLLHEMPHHRPDEPWHIGELGRICARVRLAN